MKLIDDFFAQSHTLPMLPKVVQEVMQLLRAEEVDTRALADKINHDQVLSAKVLRMSNSAYFGQSGKVSTVEDAMSLIGLAKLNTLVIASGVTAAFTEVPNLDLKRFWQHSLTTAGVARQLAADLKMDGETAYIAGLMHTIGQLPLHMVFPKAGADIDIASKGRSVLERHEIEHAVLGTDHNVVGEKLAKHWHFPDDISRVIRYYTDPLNQHAGELAPVIYVAAHIAFDLESNQKPAYIAETLSEDIAAKLKLTDTGALAERIESYRIFVDEAKSYL